MLALLACGKPPDATPPKKILTTYRAITGVSMGAAGTAALGFLRPERFDVIASQGGPLDAALLLRTIDHFHLGGFCPLADLEAIAKQDPARLNDPDAVRPCMRRPASIQWERSQDYNHWAFTTNGGTFDRDAYLKLFTDLTLAYGNLITENPASPFAPPGVDPTRLRKPPADFCANPVRVKGLRNAEYNPDGKYDAITYCDGQPRLYFCRDNQELVDFCSDPRNKATPLPVSAEQAFADAYCAAKGGSQVADKRDHPLFMLNNAGEVDPCREPTDPMLVALAVDLNGNGRRDYGEPILSNAQERYDDVGADGCADAYEDGAGGCLGAPSASAADPNRDNYDAELNALGTEADWLWEEGEPYRDLGLDGVAGTADQGEGNGQYDMVPGRRTLLSYDARSNLRKMEPDARGRLDFLADGGIRDLFNFGLASKQVFGLLRAYHGERPAGVYRDFLEIPGMVDKRTGAFAPWNARWRSVPRDLLLLYGKEQPTDDDRVQGEGDHVGTAGQAVNRFYTLFNWAAASWPSLERPSTPFGGAPASERHQMAWYPSKLLDAPREYGVALPPGYELPENAEKRYPVMYMLHGYGMRPEGFLASALIPDAYVTDPDVRLRPMIIVFADGACCFVNQATLARDCREKDETKTYLGDKPGFVRECNAGTFYVNRKGYTWDDALPYGDAFFELMDHVDQSYRTLPPAEVDSR
ncbi:MAG: hypothetical protein HYZ28_21755 [Myxococcales bacterium]|nr:hypothetical protein [Myxococcales bacterium]